MVSSSPCFDISFVILTTAAILTLNNQVHKVLGYSAVVHVALAHITATVFVANVVEYQNIFADVSKWRKFFVFAIPFELNFDKFVSKNHESELNFQDSSWNLLLRNGHVGCHQNNIKKQCRLHKLSWFLHCFRNQQLVC